MVALDYIESVSFEGIEQTLFISPSKKMFSIERTGYADISCDEESLYLEVIAPSLDGAQLIYKF